MKPSVNSFTRQQQVQEGATGSPQVVLLIESKLLIAGAQPCIAEPECQRGGNGETARKKGMSPSPAAGEK